MTLGFNHLSKGERTMLVSQILKTKSTDALVMVLPDLKVAAAARMLGERRIGTLLVSKDGKTADGIISERDIVRAIGETGGGCLDKTVADLMTSRLVTCKKEDRSEAILQQMTEGRFRHMPVLEDGVLIGLVSLGDVVNAQLMVLSMEKDALQGMIMGH